MTVKCFGDHQKLSLLECQIILNVDFHICRADDNWCICCCFFFFWKKNILCHLNLLWHTKAQRNSNNKQLLFSAIPDSTLCFLSLLLKKMCNNGGKHHLLWCSLHRTAGFRLRPVEEKWQSIPGSKLNYWNEPKSKENANYGLQMPSHAVWSKANKLKRLKV